MLLRAHHWPSLHRIHLIAFAIAIAGLIAAVLLARDTTQPSTTRAPAARTPAPAASPAEQPKRISAAILGDSYTAGANATSPRLGYAERLARSMGWKDAYIRGLPGAGYAKRSVDHRTLHGLIRRVLRRDPKVVLVVAGHNDARAVPAHLSRHALRDLRELRRGLPHTRIFVVGPIWQGTNFRPGVLTARALIRAAVRRVGRIGWIDPLRERWFTGDRRLHTGNAARLISRDDNHPNNAGHAHIARILGRDLRARGVERDRGDG